jgi:peptidyl-prolyl cis-trans isomerase-like 1
MSGAEYVTFDTNVGQFTVELYTKHAPKVSYSMCTLAEGS